MGWPCARTTGKYPPVISSPGILAWDTPFLKPFSQLPPGCKQGSPSSACSQGVLMGHWPVPPLPSGCPALCPSRGPLYFGPPQAEVCVFPCLGPGSVHVLFSPSGQAAPGGAVSRPLLPPPMTFLTLGAGRRGHASLCLSLPWWRDGRREMKEMTSYPERLRSDSSHRCAHTPALLCQEKACVPQVRRVSFSL